MNGRAIDDADVDLLIDKGLGHTRRIIDSQLFSGLLAGWASLFAASVIYMLILSGLTIGFE